MMNIEELLDLLDEQLDRAWSLPLSGGKSVVDAEKVRNLVDDIRLSIPTEIKQAKAIVADRTEIITTARKEAENIVHKAEERARVLISQEEITRVAQEKANEMVAQAAAKAKEIRQVSQEFSDDLLKRSEEVLAKYLSEVKETRQAVRGASFKMPQPKEEEPEE